MTRVYTFGALALVLFILCFAAWKVLHLSTGPVNEMPAAAQAALEHPAAMTIASIGKGTAGREQIAGYGLLQAAEVGSAEVREQCALTLLACISDVGKSPECFEPSLAIKVSTAAGEFIFLPCFKCGHMKIISRLAGQNEDWSWVEIRAAGTEFEPIFHAVRLIPPPPT